MIIFIPSYKRFEILRHVIQSALNADYSQINEKVTIIIRNNYLVNKKKIDSLVFSIQSKTSIEILVVHDARIPSVFFWYETILLHSKKNETIIILSSDDILLPWGIENRYREINRLEGDLLISKHTDLCIFDREKDVLHTTFSLEKFFSRKDKTKKAYEEIDKFYSSGFFFISNHCFRNTNAFRQAIKLTYNSCVNYSKANEFTYNLDPISLDDGFHAPNRKKNYFQGEIPAFGTFPLLLFYNLIKLDAKILELDEISVLRGFIWDEFKECFDKKSIRFFFYSIIIYDFVSKINSEKYADFFLMQKKNHLKDMQNNLYKIIIFGHINDFKKLCTLLSCNLSFFKDILISRGIFNYKSFLSAILPNLIARKIKKIVSNNKYSHNSVLFIEKLKKDYNHLREKFNS